MSEVPKKSVKEYFFHILEKEGTSDLPSVIVDRTLMLSIFVSVMVIILETVPSYEPYKPTFFIIECVLVGIFTLEYIMRLWVSDLKDGFSHPIKGRIRHMLTPLAIVDLLAILPFYLPLFFMLEFAVLRVLRLIRLLRMLKFLRYSNSIQAFRDVIRLKYEELTMVFIITVIVLIFSAAILYHFEHEAQPEAFSSIPAAMWWGVATLTTVGYGDIYPVTSIGRFFASVIALMGVGLVALPAGILGSGFVAIKRRQSGGSFTCPHCKEEIKRGGEPTIIDKLL
jgi:voltage-gated potassium channel